MATLIAKYTFAQRNDEGLNTTPAIYNDAMGIVGSDPLNRLEAVASFLASSFPATTFSASADEFIVDFNPDGPRDIFYGYFLNTFISDDYLVATNQIDGMITGWTSGIFGSDNERYTVSGININAQMFFRHATWADILDGGDTLIGGPGPDVLQSYGTSNIFQGLGGRDVFIAATGAISTAVFRGQFHEYQVVSSDNLGESYLSNISGYEVVDSVLNRDDQAILVNIERLQFTDTMLALDTGANQNAGNAYLLYQAAFDRTPDAAGLGYWIHQVDQGANIVTDVALNFILSDEFIGLYGANPPVTEFMDLLYQNVLNRTPDAAGYEYWLNEFARDGDSLAYRASILNNFAISAENVANVADQIATGILYQAYVG